MEVRGPRLLLRYATPADTDALFALGSDPEVVRYFSWGPYGHRDEAAAFVDRVTDERAAGEKLELLIAERASGEVIGLTGLSEFARRDRRAFVGTWLGREHWGTGANRESKALVLWLAFRELGLHRVSAYANPENGRSVRALERIGFQYEGVLRSWHVHRDRFLDVAIFGLLHDEWAAGPLAETPVELAGEPPPDFLAQIA
jgi:ribosomal-protein-alanine N-acetyltransferase